MFQRKVVKNPTGLVWRMSATNLAGEFVLPSARHRKDTDSAELHDRGFHASSLDLSIGSDVLETEMHTLPGELIDAFIKADR